MKERDQKPATRSAVSRREFLKGSGMAVAATSIATHDSSAAEPGSGAKRVLPAAPVDMTLNVNGKDYQLKLEPRVTLLEALRDDLHLTGCKHADDTTTTGTDTVIIDGKAILASARLAVECQGQKIQTVESLAQGDQVDDVVTGFVKHDGLQCGFCTPGFVMATRAFLNKHPNATEKEIRKGLGGNLCRCGTYHGIMNCALEIARKG